MTEQSRDILSQAEQNIAIQCQYLDSSADSVLSSLRQAREELQQKKDSAGIYAQKTLSSLVETLDMCIQEMEICQNALKNLE